MELALSLGGDTQKPFSFLEKSTNNSSSHEDIRFCIGLGKSNNNTHEDEPGLRNGPERRVLDMNRRPIILAEENSKNAVSSFQMELSSIYRNGKRDSSSNCRGVSDEEDENNGLLARKKLRLTKQQSAFLEENFKQHNTLNPKQKLALAKQLKLRPRQVEVWFQNRRARTKLKQTELDCEYLKRCCETLKEENRRLQKELQELRALKSSQPFYMQLPATTLTMCPSCERVATTAATRPSLQPLLPRPRP